MIDNYDKLCEFNFGKRCYVIVKNNYRVLYFESVNGNYVMPITSYNLFDNEGKSLTAVNQHFFMSQLVNRINVSLKKGFFSSNEEISKYLNDIKVSIENDQLLMKLFKGSFMQNIDENNFEDNKRKLIEYLDKFKFDTFISYNNVSIFNGSLEKNSGANIINNDLSDNNIDLSDTINNEVDQVNEFNVNNNSISDFDFTDVEKFCVNDSNESIDSNDYFKSVSSNDDINELNILDNDEDIGIIDEDNFSKENVVSLSGIDYINEVKNRLQANSSTLNQVSFNSEIESVVDSVELVDFNNVNDDVNLNSNAGIDSNTISGVNNVFENVNTNINMGIDTNPIPKVNNTFENVNQNINAGIDSNTISGVNNAFENVNLNTNMGIDTNTIPEVNNAFENVNQNINTGVDVNPIPEVNNTFESVNLNTNMGIDTNPIPEVNNAFESVNTNINTGVDINTFSGVNSTSEVVDFKPSNNVNISSVVNDKSNLPELEDVSNSQGNEKKKNKEGGKAGVIIFMIFFVVALLALSYYLYNYVF